MPKAGRWRPTLCTRCGAKADDGATISTRGRCTDCAQIAVEEAIRQVHARSGPRYDRWREGMARAAESA